MKQSLLFIILLFSACQTIAQHTLSLTIKSAEDSTTISEATVFIEMLNKTSIADSTGKVTFSNMPEGKYSVKISHIGYESTAILITVPQSTAGLDIYLNPNTEEQEEIVITATRSSRSIRDDPTRVEIISGEELTEKGNMKPGDIRMMLNESTGIQTQQTSATSYSSAIRIQGLDGRYTQLLRDGLPLYSGFSGGLSLMQIAPLDLKQVEVIKGSSSTLYGGGAIAGLVNLVSKTPVEKPELSFLANATSAKGLDLSGFYSQRFKSVGATIFASRNSGSPYDPADIGLTAIPKFERYTINPKLFLYGKKNNASVGFSYIGEDRVGGSTAYIKTGSPGYFEANKTTRFTSQADVRSQITDQASFNLKISYSNFNREISIPGYTFEARQQSTYSELNFTYKNDGVLWIAGANFITDGLDEAQHSSAPSRDYQYNTVGMFVQNTWSAGKFTLETGLRGDYLKPYGFELLPRLSAMLKFSNNFTARLGGGLGYKTPTVFNEESERIQFRNILPVNERSTNNERSLGSNLDFNYRTNVGSTAISINQLFFYTRLNKPLVLQPAAQGYEFINAAGYIDTKGIETNLRFSYSDFKLFVGYTYADVNTHAGTKNSWFPLTAKNRLNNVLMYELEEKLKIGLEAYYIGRQRLNGGTIGQSYWINGLMAEKLWERFSIFINFENIFDARQTRFDTIYTGSASNPVFRDIYAPIDGFVINGGFKIRL